MSCNIAIFILLYIIHLEYFYFYRVRCTYNMNSINFIDVNLGLLLIVPIFLRILSTASHPSSTFIPFSPLIFLLPSHFFRLYHFFFFFYFYPRKVSFLFYFHFSRSKIIHLRPIPNVVHRGAPVSNPSRTH